MKTISKKITVYIFVGLLVFCSTSTTYYRSVHAFEYAGGAIAFGEALKWLLGAIGIASVGGMTADYWDDHADEFEDYCAQQNITNTEVANWQMKLCEGILDKSSDCWEAFKTWASNLHTADDFPSGGGSAASSELQLVLNTVNSEFGTNYTLGTGWDNIDIYGVVCSRYGANNAWFKILYTDTSYSWNWTNTSASISFTSSTASLSNIQINNGILNFPNSSDGIIGVTSPYDAGYTPLNPSMRILLFGVENVSTFPYVKTYSLSGSSSGSTTLKTVNKTINTTNIINNYYTDEASPEVTIPMPGVNIDDDTLANDTSREAYDDIMDRVQSGELSLEDAIEEIQDILNVITYDTVTDDIIPNRPNPDNNEENIKKDDVINDHKNNLRFTLGGLEKVFPFCIPWDIYALMNLLVADPVAPEFDFPIKSVNNTTENIHVDLSPFEPVAVVVRYIFDFLFIVGLGMLTRSMIGGGSSD